jgi:hypothetical protein
MCHNDDWALPNKVEKDKSIKRESFTFLVIAIE